MEKRKTIGLDTSIIIYLIEQHPRYFPAVYPIFQAIEAGRYQAIFSTLGLIELLTGPKKEKREDLVIKYQDYLAAYTNLAIVDVLQPIIINAVQLRADYGIATPDSIHLATAMVFEVDEFITNDKALRKVKEVNVKII